MPFPRALLIDLDDTILAFDAVADDCWRSLCQRHATEAGASPERIYEAIQSVRKWYWSDPERHRLGRLNLKRARREVVALAFEQLQLCVEPLANKLADDYSTERDLLVYPFPGAIAALQALRLRGIDLALLTNGDSFGQRAKIQRHDLAQYFSCIVIEEEFGLGKPDEAVFKHALQALGHPPEQACMIGNSLEFDVLPALKLGLSSVWISSSTEQLPGQLEHGRFQRLTAFAEVASWQGFINTPR